jgi:hypothetical protein
MFSCRTRGFCPSCHAKRLEEWDDWMREELLLDVPHRQVVFTIPRMLRIFFKYNRRLLGNLCIDHLKLTFVAERPPLPHLAYQEVLMAAEKKDRNPLGPRIFIPM